MQAAAGGEQEEAMSAMSVIEVRTAGGPIINVEESRNQEYTEDLSVWVCLAIWVAWILA